jgi:hypothetical protein
MREFFYGWRRKAGVVSLVMAVAVMGMWARSFVVVEQLRVSACSVASIRGTVAAVRSTLPQASPQPTYSKYLVSEIASFKPDENGNYPDWWGGVEVDQRWDLAGFHFGRRRIDQDQQSIIQLGFPYWSLALPLTLLSAYLILWKPRKPREPSHA